MIVVLFQGISIFDREGVKVFFLLAVSLAFAAEMATPGPTNDVLGTLWETHYTWDVEPLVPAGAAPFPTIKNEGQLKIERISTQTNNQLRISAENLASTVTLDRIERESNIRSGAGSVPIIYGSEGQGLSSETIRIGEREFVLRTTTSADGASPMSEIIGRLYPQDEPTYYVSFNETMSQNTVMAASFRTFYGGRSEIGRIFLRSAGAASTHTPFPTIFFACLASREFFHQGSDLNEMCFPKLNRT